MSTNSMYVLKPYQLRAIQREHFVRHNKGTTFYITWTGADHRFLSSHHLMATKRVWRVVQKGGTAADNPESPSQQWKPINLPLPRTYAVRAQMENESHLNTDCIGPSDHTNPTTAASIENYIVEDMGNATRNSHSELQSVVVVKDSEDSCDPFKVVLESSICEKKNKSDESSDHAKCQIIARTSTEEASLEIRSSCLCPEMDKDHIADASKRSTFEHASEEEMGMEKETGAQRLTEESGGQYKEEYMGVEEQNDLVEQVGITDVMESEVEVVQSSDVEEVNMEKETRAVVPAGDFCTEETRAQVDQTSRSESLKINIVDHAELYKGTAIGMDENPSVECQDNNDKSEEKPIPDNYGEESKSKPVQVVDEDGEIGHEEIDTSANTTKEDSNKKKGKGKSKGKGKDKDKEKELWKNKTKNKWQVKGKEKENQDEVGEVNAEEQISKDDRLSAEEFTATVKVDIPFLKFFTGKRVKSREKIEKDTQTKISVPSPNEVKHGSCLVVEGPTQENVDRAVSQIHDMLKESAESPSLDYSHFISLPLAIYPAFTEQVIKFHDFVLSLIPAKEDVMENKRRRRRGKVKTELPVPTTETEENLVNLEEIFGEDDVVSKTVKLEDEAEEYEQKSEKETSMHTKPQNEVEKGVEETNNERVNNQGTDPFGKQQEELNVMDDEGSYGMKKDVEKNENQELVGKQQEDIDAKYERPYETETEIGYSVGGTKNDQHKDNEITDNLELGNAVHNEHDANFEGTEQQKMQDEGFCEIKEDEIGNVMDTDTIGKPTESFDTKSGKTADENNNEMEDSVVKLYNEENRDKDVPDMEGGIEDLDDLLDNEKDDEIHSNPGPAGEKVETDIGDSLGKANNGQGIEESIFIKPTRVHLTILMLKLWNEERVDAAKQVLQGLKLKLFDVLDNRPVAVHLRGLECMRGSPAKAHVLYAKVEEVDEENRLRQACNILREAFIEAGLVTEKEKKQELKLHATLMNTTQRKRKKGKRFNKPIPFDAREIISKYGAEDWGEHRITEAHLSQRFVYGEDDYYHCCSSISFPSSPK